MVLEEAMQLYDVRVACLRESQVQIDLALHTLAQPRRHHPALIDDLKRHLAAAAAAVVLAAVVAAVVAFVAVVVLVVVVAVMVAAVMVIVMMAAVVVVTVALVAAAGRGATSQASKLLAAAATHTHLMTRTSQTRPVHVGETPAAEQRAHVVRLERRHGVRLLRLNCYSFSFPRSKTLLLLDHGRGQLLRSVQTACGREANVTRLIANGSARGARQPRLN